MSFPTCPQIKSNDIFYVIPCDCHDVGHVVLIVRYAYSDEDDELYFVRWINPVIRIKTIREIFEYIFKSGILIVDETIIRENSNFYHIIYELENVFKDVPKTNFDSFLDESREFLLTYMKDEDPEFKEFKYILITLNNKFPFWKRVVLGLKYLFGFYRRKMLSFPMTKNITSFFEVVKRECEVYNETRC